MTWNWTVLNIAAAKCIYFYRIVANVHTSIAVGYEVLVHRVRKTTCRHTRNRLCPVCLHRASTVRTCPKQTSIFFSSNRNIV